MVPCFALILLFSVLVPSHAQTGLHFLPTHHVRQAVVTNKAPVVDVLPGTVRLNLSIMLPLRNQATLAQLLRQLYDPSSPEYRHFLNVSQFTHEFGPTPGDYQAVADWAQSKGFIVGDRPANNLLVPITGTAAQINAAFNVSMKVYQHPTENRLFFAPDREPSVDLNVPLWHIAGLDDYSIPHPAMVKASGSPAQTTGSGPGGLFLPGDMRAAYYGGTSLTGSGQIVGLVEFGGYNIGDVALTFDGAAKYSTNGTNYTLFYTTGGVRYSIPINNVPVGGYVVGDSGDVGEQALDIAQTIGIAPGLSQVRVYTAPYDFITSGSYTFPANSNGPAIYNAMASDSGNLANQLSQSWLWEPEDIKTNDSVFQEFAAQGQNLFVSAGDHGAFDHSVYPYFYPAEDLFITAVGGTDLSTTGPGGNWVSETAWNNPCSNQYGKCASGGGISPDSVPIPSWQGGVANSSNGGSTTLRNVPDVAAEANTDNYYCDMGSCTGINGTGASGGTSYAAPRWAGFLALVNQQAVASGIVSPGGGIGFINPFIYEIGLSSNYDSNFHDINSGNNDCCGQSRWFDAVNGYDLVTGWGSPNGQTLINSLTSSETTQLNNFSFTEQYDPTFSVTVLDANGQLVDGGSVTFSFCSLYGGGCTTICSAQVTGTGQTSCQNPVNNQSGQEYTLTATYSGFRRYQGSSTQETVIGLGYAFSPQ